jgi:hypothetical protein
MARSIVLTFMIGKLLNMNIIRIITILFLVSMLASCDKTLDFLSKSVILDMKPPPGPPEFQAGYIDGCSTALNENQHNIIAMNRKRLYKHPIMNNKSNLYRKMWRSAYIYCGLWVPYLASKMKASIFQPSFRLNVKAMPGTVKKNLIEGAPPGPENFRIGWRHGCDTGKAATGRSKHKLVYKFFKDARFIEGDGFEPTYDKGWETAFWYCQRYYDVLESPQRRQMI